MGQLPNLLPFMSLQTQVKIISIIQSILDYAGVWYYGFALEFLGEIYPTSDDQKKSLKSFKWNIYFISFLVSNKFVFSTLLYAGAKTKNTGIFGQWIIISIINGALSLFYLVLKYEIEKDVTGQWWTTTGQIVEITLRSSLAFIEIFFIYVVLAFKKQVAQVGQGVATSNNVELGGQSQTGGGGGTQAVDEQQPATISSQDVQQ
ncbi:unnamed protein product [Orchesella dallaii]|uniref:Transmembrane protein n=1 Tax=Orchesella dallaii TaxID=48710 RepID=A0ABP1QGJ7_9HEXA